MSIKVRFLIIILFFLVFPLLQTSKAVATTYEIIQLSSTGSENWYPDINNYGEVVWQGWDGQHTNIYSNFRGKITNNNTDNHFPAINDNGEIVWMQWDNGYSIYSNIRGLIQEATTNFWNYNPDINNNREVVFDKCYSDYCELFSNVHGLISTSSIYQYFSPSINNNGEIVWQGWDSNDYEIFSNIRGQLTDNQYNDYSWYGSKINDLGEIVWFTEIPGEIYSNVRGQITSDNVDDQASAINNVVEIVWMRHDPDLGLYHIYSNINGMVTPPNMDARYPVINDSGQIAFQSGQHVYLANPIPEPAPNISVSPTSIDFGTVNVGNSSAPQSFTISNTGTADLHISGMSLSDTTNYSLNVNGGSSPCGSTTPTIVPYGSCTVTVTFSPSSTGTKDANLTISSDDPDTPTLNVPLSGIGVQDTTPPTIDVIGCPLKVNLNTLISVTVTVTDTESGVAYQSAPTGNNVLDTSGVGTKTFAVTARDNRGNTGSNSCIYQVVYDFSGAGGFQPPVDAPPTTNTAKAGSTIPVKWQLPNGSGGFISDLGAVISIKAQQVACSNFSSTLTDPVDTTATGDTVLRYDLTSNQYIYNWKTCKTWAGKCYILNLTLNDGMSYQADFSLK